MKISRILHAGYVFESDQTKIAFDPLFENPFSRNCYAFPNVEFDYTQIKKLKFDAVFISHYHDDHCSFESLNLIDRATPIYIYCLYDEMIFLIKKLGFTNVHQIEINITLQIGRFEITPRTALDADVDSIFHIKAKNYHVLNVVDSWIDLSTLDLLARQAPWDLILWPFQTMQELEVIAPSRLPRANAQLPPEWLEQLQILKPKYIVPSSCQFIHENWSWYNQAFFPITYQQFEQDMLTILPQTKVIRLNPSVSITLNEQGVSFSEALSWIKPIGNQNVDYDFNKNLVPPLQAEVAKNFAPLNTQQISVVEDYCQNQLIKKFQSLQPTDEAYFNKNRIWRLRIYDHTGSFINYDYLINMNSVKLLIQNATAIEWLTEISIHKFYAALKLGESLTSMYLRVNDTQFSNEVENELKNVDIFTDPLIRCLFEGEFASYQRYQLKKINTPL